MTAHKKSQLTLYPGNIKELRLLKMRMMMRWGPLCSHRSLWEQHWVLKNLWPELSIYSSPLISASGVGGGVGNRWSTPYFRRSQLEFRSYSETNTMKKCLQSFSDWRRRIKQIFVFTGNTKPTWLTFSNLHHKKDKPCSFLQFQQSISTIQMMYRY